jgi:arylsulfatase A-like enzyme
MPRPNILLTFTDQQRADTIGADGNSLIKTPHLDRLAAEGAMFRSNYTTSPVCVSARCSLITGQYPHRNGCYNNGYPMPEDRPSMMDLLADAGYRTHGIGKMHFTPDPHALRGFQSREQQAEIVGRVENDDYLQFLHENGFEHVHDPFGQRSEMYYVPQPSQLPARLHGTNWVGDRAVEFLRQADDGQPFFLWASFIHPHPPFSPPTPWNKLYRAPLVPPPHVPQQPQQWHTWWNRSQNRSKYRDQGIDLNLVRCMKAYYWACVSFIDFQVGRMLEALEERGMLDNTLIIHTSDHGEMLGDYDCFGKRTMLDPAARVPAIARLPGRFEGGRVVDRTPTSLVDVMPTVLAAAEVQAPAGQLDGVDLTEVLKGRHDDRTVFAQIEKDTHGLHMACDRNWKYFYSAADEREFLVDRRGDPDETRNRAGLCFCRDATERMRSRLIERYRADGYTEALEGDGWRSFGRAPFPEDTPDARLLVQDPGWAEPYKEIPGYTDQE